MEKNSLAWEIIQDSKKTNKRMFIIILVILTMWFATIGYLVYVLNDCAKVETIQEVSDVETIGGSVNNG